MLTKNLLLDVKTILKKIPASPGAAIADLGCGNFGYFVFPLARLIGKQGKVYAVDVIKSALDDIKRKAKAENLPQIETVWSNLEIYGATKIKKETLDMAILINTLHQAVRPIDMLKETIRMIKPEGEILIIDWDDKDYILGPSAGQRIKKDKLLSAAEKLNLKLVEDFRPGRLHYGLVFAKK